MIEAAEWAQKLAPSFSPQQAHLPGGSLFIMAGLPASGKSTVVANLLPQMPATVVKTDEVRKMIYPQPSYLINEVDSVYAVCHELIKILLNQNERVIFDAVNPLRSRRNELYLLASETNSAVALGYLYCDEQIIQSRMKKRWSDAQLLSDKSDANFAVYHKLKSAFEPLQLPHLALDSGRAEPSAVAAQIAAYWEKIEPRHVNEAG